MKKFIIILLVTLIWACKTAQTPVIVEEAIEIPTGQLDPESGFIADPSLYLLKAHCTACHSSKLVTSNRFTREGWKQKIVWMQETQNLWDLGEMEPAILDYLAKYYSPELKDSRRSPLPSQEWYYINQ